MFEFEEVDYTVIKMCSEMETYSEISQKEFSMLREPINPFRGWGNFFFIGDVYEISDNLSYELFYVKLLLPYFSNFKIAVKPKN